VSFVFYMEIPIDMQLLNIKTEPRGFPKL